MNQSYIFKQNISITFTYKDRPESILQKKGGVFKSLIFTKQNRPRRPLAQVTKSIVLQGNVRGINQMAQSMSQQSCFQSMKAGQYQMKDSVGNEMLSRLAKMSQLRGKQILQERYQASIQDFQVGELLGKGGMGNVYVCRHTQTGFFFAIKKIKKKTVADINQLIHSIKMHMFLNQPNIVKLYSVFADSEHIYLLMQLCIDGDLKSQAKSIRTAKQTKRYILEIAYGLRHLHHRNIRHGDIKLQNILCSYGMPKIADFDCISCGRQRNTTERKLNSKILGSPLYFSPEMMGQSIFGLNDDVWSLGIICYEIICGYYPFSITSPSDLLNILSKDIKQFPLQTDLFLQDLTGRMLSKRMCERPKLSSIIKQLQRN